ncbi:S-adenosyl-L-methionine-dependent methyltransferase [Lipomyces oligophaga]|uniref:S-adenosyl-L-methionine-dependent methyltransferase n=1 Tax=Lipomyces oligophaga TaxID=45792 RepID=UPI0034CD849D
MSSVIALETGDEKNIKTYKTLLEHLKIFDRKRGISRANDKYLIFTTKENNGNTLQDLERELELPETARLVSVESTVIKSVSAGGSNLRVAVEQTLKVLNGRYPLSDDEVQQFIVITPNRYYIYGNLLLISAGSFAESELGRRISHEFPSFFHDFYVLLSAQVGVTHIALNAPISDYDNQMRKPMSLQCLFGNFGPSITQQSISAPSSCELESEFWATTRQNGIYQTWAPRYTMFSRGNIKEKARVLGFKRVKDNMIVDLYAGIGYFTFSYIEAGARTVFCWEINPWSVEGLLRGARVNKWSVQLVRHEEKWESRQIPKIVVFLENNRHAVSRYLNEIRDKVDFPLSHINLGLLPDSKQGWETAVELSAQSSESSVVLHVHANVLASGIDAWTRETENQLTSLAGGKKVRFVDISKIKSFAPGVCHVCGDFELLI